MSRSVLTEAQQAIADRIVEMIGEVPHPNDRMKIASAVVLSIVSHAAAYHLPANADGESIDPDDAYLAAVEIFCENTRAFAPQALPSIVYSEAVSGVAPSGDAN